MIEGGLVLGVTVTLPMALTPVGVIAGFATLGAHATTQRDLGEYYNYEVVQNIVDDKLSDEMTELDDQLANGEITDGEYLRMKKDLENQDRDELVKKTADEVFAEDEEYNALLKKDDKLMVGHIVTSALGFGSLAYLGLGFLTGYVEKFADIAFDAMDTSYLLKEEEDKKKQDEEYSEEIER